MTFPVSLEPSRKRQESDYLDPLRPPSKRLKHRQPASAYWDSLSKIWLTRDALEELDRRNRASHSVPESLYFRHRPLTRQLQARLKRCHQTPAPDPLISCKPESLSKIKRLSRQGGPDLSDLRNFPDPYTPCYQSMSANSSGHRKRRAGTPPDSSNSNTKTTKTTSTTAYNRNFEQKLIDHGIYPPGYKYPDGQKPAKPDNWQELNERLAQPRASLSPSKFSEQDFEEFVEADVNASKEKPIVRLAIPIIEGRVDDIKCMGGDYPFGNLAALTDGTLANAKPDHFFGARPEQLNHEIRDELSEFVIPSTQSSLPIAPNFFLETKGPDGSLAVATRQACYHGALGARGMHKLQSYKQDEPSSDNNAYTITSIYHGGQLKLYTTHPTAPRESDGRPEYIMTSLRSFAMADGLDTFRSGASAYRNARDWAKEQRDEFIKSANERHTQAPSEHLSSEREPTSEPTVVLEDSDTLATSDEAGLDNAEWSFAHPNDNVEDASNRYTRAEPTNSTSRKSPQN
ncbi:hypothetical protein H112_08546 [Trichophyton rubrum D6]|uniref:DUF7924 domain-containing protein n=4 Tax=Trichophyton TaxID=5550 RepID=A0A178EU94_TRIRU|nr:uncharacterized protein TERG_01104 [Trichophyton rubrum CBS 118892]EZF10130.1 hypothetical protein H100_08569 [Trichophyton rubrum MR850]EZF37046.1 hypothetical protein H102_08528 [Trichophyton rubrum CBS 100081]EZF47821.1 hypothetical protein H103_08550 [Trichophyton rubrum CBS 288.86]EZF58338.1 hypothetical protein H104_08502 [Trichophyton rubrum CBS 289.86]EZF68892.1 hypothetical protein H105_08557 [Trichophyton soudanense CBS 452.61]EZF79624.1 hypothetical protein H110_08552 [Trichophy